jgi:surfeit locus 1 family protein
MIGRLVRAGLLWPTVLSIVGVAILIGLGSWQLSRKAEKEALIAKIDARRLGDPIDLEAILEDRGAVDVDYQRLVVRGEFVAGKERFYYAPQPKLGPGYDVYQPLTYAPGKVVWVNRGFIPRRVKDNPEIWQAGLGETSITGNARLPAKPGTFTPDNDLAANMWYWRDLAGMHASAFGADAGIDAAPFFVVAGPAQHLSGSDKSSVGDIRWPQPGVSEFAVVNKHLEYAVTWFGLALTLVGVYAVYAWTRLRP